MQKLNPSDLIALSNNITNAFPDITEPRIPLSETGVSTRIYSHWRSKGIIGVKSTNEEIHRWVKLNLFDYVWLEIIKSLRVFGFPLEGIKELREQLFKNVFEMFQGTDEEVNNQLLELAKDKINKQDLVFFKTVMNFRYHIPDEHKLFLTEFGVAIINILFQNQTNSLVLKKSKNGFDSMILNDFLIVNYKKQVNDWLIPPHIQIPLNPIINNFIDSPENEKDLIYWGLLNEDEEKVLDAMRKNEFKELTIRFNGNDKMTLEGTIEGDILNEKALEAKRTFGLNQYHDVSLKYRNDKHIYFKAKVKL